MWFDLRYDVTSRLVAIFVLKNSIYASQHHTGPDTAPKVGVGHGQQKEIPLVCNTQGVWSTRPTREAPFTSVFGVGCRHQVEGYKFAGLASGRRESPGQGCKRPLVRPKMFNGFLVQVGCELVVHDMAWVNMSKA